MKATELLHILKIQNKRLFVMWLVTFIAFIGLLGYTIWLLNQYEYVDESVIQDNENGYNNYIGNDGDINYGKTDY